VLFFNTITESITGIGKVTMPGRLLFMLSTLMLLTTLFFCCGQDKKAGRIALPTTPIISSYSKWAVIKIDYLRIRARPVKDAEMLGSTGMGAVVRILSQTEPKDESTEQKNTWYEIEAKGIRGWVVGRDLVFFNSESEALDYAEELR
jgi:hypothetical protein